MITRDIIFCQEVLRPMLGLIDWRFATPSWPSYPVHPQEVVGVTDKTLPPTCMPAVLLSVEDGFASEHVQKVLDDFAHRDNVFCDDFNSAVILQFAGSHGVKNTAAAVAELAENHRFQAIHTHNPSPTHPPSPLAQGPYFIRGKSIHQAWKLYDDHLDAFVILTIPDDVANPTSLSVLQAVLQQGNFKSIAVPSRLNFYIKDNFDLKGIRTTMMNRAYNELYPPRTSSADYGIKLIGLVAVIVGRTKMSAFASADEPTDQWVDYHCRFNPRGGMYQTPSCSSTSAGASLAGYSWLGHSIGSDSDIRLSAAFKGLFGLGTSYVLTSTWGIVPSCNEFDTVGTLHRSLKDAKHLTIATLDPMTEAFITIVEKFLGATRTPISITGTWASKTPDEAGGRRCWIISKCAVRHMYHDTYHTFDDFRRDYPEKFGKPAFVGPYMRTRWGIAVPFTKEQRAQGVAEMKNTVTDAVIIMPFGSAVPKYRDDTNKLPSIVGSFSVFYLPAVLQLPTLMVPIGLKPYGSRISGRKEYLPIVSSFMGARCNDVVVLNLAEAALKSAK
ncbi:putative amidase [Podospora didyma]|uniref:Amidase n=1 Tax=Podospora didyma TaxID=330526 RepID=A0AAE0P8G8_9PEZI|nr:putative amidase [Podospora didyma]